MLTLPAMILIVVFVPIFCVVPIASLFKAPKDTRTFHERFRCRFKIILKTELISMPFVLALVLLGNLTQSISSSVILSVLCFLGISVFVRLKDETSSYKEQVKRRLIVIAELVAVILLVKAVTLPLPVKQYTDTINTISGIIMLLCAVVSIRELVLWNADNKKKVKD